MLLRLLEPRSKGGRESVTRSCWGSPDALGGMWSVVRLQCCCGS